MSKELEYELENMKRCDQITDWSKTLGYGDVEYTIEVRNTTPLSLQSLAKSLSKRYNAHTFQKFVDGSAVSVKFVVNL